MTNKSATAAVELLIFSGRPNPKWVLSSQQVKELLASVAKLPRTTATLPPEQLGYSGFWVEVTSSPKASSTLKVFRGIVAVTTAGEVVYRQDVKRIVEHWLLQTLSTQLDEELSDVINQEIDKQE